MHVHVKLAPEAMHIVAFGPHGFDMQGSVAVGMHMVPLNV